MLGEEQKIINKHPLVEVSKICDTKETKANQVEMLDARVADTYNTNERWVVKKMKLKYVNKIATFLPIIY
jgi:hypothetical protein